jgi:hypothetical protein
VKQCPKCGTYMIDTEITCSGCQDRAAAKPYPIPQIIAAGAWIAIFKQFGPLGFYLLPGFALAWWSADPSLSSRLRLVGLLGLGVISALHVARYL